MKKICLSLLLALTLCLGLCAPAAAFDRSAYQGGFSSDGVLKWLPEPPEAQRTYHITTYAYLFINSVKQTDPNILLAPVFDYTAYIPLRLVSQELGARVDYAKGLIIVSSGEVEIKLQLGDTKAYKSDATQTDQVINFTTPPFVCDEITYVPLRFIAEALGCQVDYDNGVINITGGTAEPFTIDGQQPVRMEFSFFTTMDANVYETTSPTLMQSAYTSLQKALGGPANPPAYVTGASVLQNGDFADRCCFGFYNAQNELIRHLHFYRQYQNPDEPALHEPARPYPFVVTDKPADISYSCTQAAYDELIAPLTETLRTQGTQTHVADTPYA